MWECTLKPDQFLDCALSNPVNAILLLRLATLELGQCHLTAGCLFQPVWNKRSDRAPEWGIKDYDVFYFDNDLSWEAEDSVIRRVGAITEDLGVRVEVRNQARVHLWFRKRFGGYYPPLASARDVIDRYLIACTCVGIDVASSALYAPDDLDDLADGILRINQRFPQPDLFYRKAEDYRDRWPWLRIVSEPASSGDPDAG